MMTLVTAQEILADPEKFAGVEASHLTGVGSWVSGSIGSVRRLSAGYAEVTIGGRPCHIPLDMTVTCRGLA